MKEEVSFDRACSSPRARWIRSVARYYLHPNAGPLQVCNHRACCGSTDSLRNANVARRRHPTSLDTKIATQLNEWLFLSRPPDLDSLADLH